jgi:hypothetical protein
LISRKDETSLQIVGSAETDLASYRRGEIPKPIKVPTPNGVILAQMTEEERRTHAWKFLSTTQGRRTALDIIKDMVVSQLAASGAKVEVRDFDDSKDTKIIAFQKWVVQLGGPGSAQPAFSFIDVASKVLAKGLIRDLRKQESYQPLFLEVISVDQLVDRTVGWAARLVL